MPGYKQHLTAGALIYFSTVILLSLYRQPLGMLMYWLTCTLAGSLFPDIDIKSKGQHIFYIVLLAFISFLSFIQYWRSLGPFVLFACIPPLTPHRGLFHNIWFLALFSCLFAGAHILLFPRYFLWAYISALFFFIGALSHVWLDLGFKKMFQK